LALAFALYGIMALHVPECWRGALNALLFVHLSKAMKPLELSGTERFSKKTCSFYFRFTGSR
jgi:hypothetical protein